MLGILENKTKEDWKSYVSTLTHAKHRTTGYSPFFLMFGRYLRLAINAFLCLDSNNTEKTRSRENVAKKLQKRLEFSYEVASREAERSASRHKRFYD
jgi:hypothetical protein